MSLGTKLDKDTLQITQYSRWYKDTATKWVDIDTESLTKKLRRINGVFKVEVNQRAETRPSGYSSYIRSVRLEFKIIHIIHVRDNLKEAIEESVPPTLKGNLDPEHRVLNVEDELLNQIGLKIPNVDEDSAKEVIDALEKIPGVTKVGIRLLASVAIICYEGTLKLRELVGAIRGCEQDVTLSDALNARMEQEKPIEKREEKREHALGTKLDKNTLHVTQYFRWYQDTATKWDDIDTGPLAKKLRKMNGVFKVEVNQRTETTSSGSSYIRSVRLELKIIHLIHVNTDTLKKAIEEGVPPTLKGNLDPEHRVLRVKDELLKQIELKIPNIDEDSAKKVIDALEIIPGVTKVAIRLLAKEATIYYEGELKLRELVGTIQDCEQDVTLSDALIACMAEETAIEEQDKKRKREAEKEEDDIEEKPKRKKAKV
ncbi:MAG: cation transporter [Candidatus Berkiellales bacterium]